MACMGGHVSKCLKEELAWYTDELAWYTDERLWVISNKMLFKAVLPLRN